MELAQPKQLTIDTKMQVYFCDTQSPWQRALTKTQTACCVSTYPKSQTCRRFFEDVPLRLQLNDITAELGSFACSGFICRWPEKARGASAEDPSAQHRPLHVQIPRGLRHHHPALLD